MVRLLEAIPHCGRLLTFSWALPSTQPLKLNKKEKKKVLKALQETNYLHELRLHNHIYQGKIGKSKFSKKIVALLVRNKSNYAQVTSVSHVKSARLV